MKSTFLGLAKKFAASLFIGGVVLLIMGATLKSVIDFAGPGDRLKAFLARAMASCLHENSAQSLKSCPTIINQMTQEVTRLRFELWVVEPDGRVFWRNTDTPPPVIPFEFQKKGSSYTHLEAPSSWRIISEAPAGFLDDGPSNKRIIIGKALEGNRPTAIRTILLRVWVAAFLVGVIIASALTYFNLSRRGKEATRVREAMQSGDFSARFRSRKLDELSDLSSSFNKIVDMLAAALKEVKNTESKRRELIGELSHDLRTPLTSMTSFIQLLQRSPRTQEGLEKECVDSISAELDYTSKLVTSLFELSQLDTPLNRTAREAVDLRPILNELKKEFEPLAYERGIRIELSDFPENIWTLGDPILTRRMFSNLIENATRFAQSEVTISAQKEGTQVAVVIWNDGPRFTDFQLAHFGKAPSKKRMGIANPREMHAGLGSVIVTRIAELHEGMVSVSNPPTGGASVRLTFQLEQQAPTLS